MTTFSQYTEGLCREHALVRHSEEECHFSDLASDFTNKLKRLMHYPCVSLDTDGFAITGQPGNRLMGEQFNLYFLQHVRDAGHYAEVSAAFAQTKGIMLDFLRRMERDRKRGVQPMTHFLDEPSGKPITPSSGPRAHASSSARRPSTAGRSVSLYPRPSLTYFATKTSTHKPHGNKE